MAVLYIKRTARHENQGQRKKESDLSAGSQKDDFIEAPGGISKTDLKRFVDDVMRSATEECFEHGADLIGHVKAFVKVGDESIMFSMVDLGRETRIQDNVTSDIVDDAIFVLHVIVHGIWDDVIRHCTLEVLPSVSDRWGVSYSIIEDYVDSEKSIAHHERR